jgi:hypothetical protein
MADQMERAESGWGTAWWRKPAGENGGQAQRHCSEAGTAQEVRSVVGGPNLASPELVER